VEKFRKSAKKIAAVSIVCLGLVMGVQAGTKELLRRKTFAKLVSDYKGLVEKDYTPKKEDFERELRKWPPWIKHFVKNSKNNSGVEIGLCRSDTLRLSTPLGITKGCSLCPILYGLDDDNKKKLEEFVQAGKGSGYGKVRAVEKRYEEDFDVIGRSREFATSVIHHELFHALFSNECKSVFDDPAYEGPKFEEITAYLKERYQKAGEREKESYREIFRAMLFHYNGKNELDDAMAFPAAVPKETWDAYFEEIFARVGHAFFNYRYSPNGKESSFIAKDKKATFGITNEDIGFFERFEFRGEKMFPKHAGNDIEIPELKVIRKD
jgi:hypothetical protein